MSRPDQDRPPLSLSAAKLRLLKSLKCTTLFEKAAWQSGALLVAGVDEVGRGSLFGCVVAAACILHPADRIRGLRDSKLLPPEVRETLAARIRQRALAWAVAEVDAARIDQINIYQASLLAMKMAVERLQPSPDFLLVDAAIVDFDCPQKKIIHGDALSASIAAASILAKVHRDALLRDWDAVYPQYGLASNKGYGTPMHKRALLQHGPCPQHRQSFAPVAYATQPHQQGLDFPALDLTEDELQCEELLEVEEAALEAEALDLETNGLAVRGNGQLC